MVGLSGDAVPLAGTNMANSNIRYFVFRRIIAITEKSMKTKRFGLCVAFAAFCATAAWATPATTLKESYPFAVGVAINANQAAGLDSRADPVVKREFNSISPENDLKWERIHPMPDRYDFSGADRYVAFGVTNGMFTVGHVLVWHSQTPDWVFRDANGQLLTRDALLKRMRDHIFTVVGRYKGRINAWDVVNEAIADDGGLRQSMWYKIIGEDYVAKAFAYAHEADPQAELIYNDYNLENPVKRRTAIALLKSLKAEGVPVTTVGLQGHYILDWPDLKQLDDAISDFAALGLKTAVTELDIDVLPRGDTAKTADVNVRMTNNSSMNPYANGLPADIEKLQSDRYAGIFAICLKYRKSVDRVTIWGVTDADTWHNDWPMKGRTAYSLLFDRAGRPKPAYFAILRAAKP